MTYRLVTNLRAVGAMLQHEVDNPDTFMGGCPYPVVQSACDQIEVIAKELELLDEHFQFSRREDNG